MMRHKIEHQVIIDGFKYTMIDEKHMEQAVDFFFDVFLKGNEL